MKVVLSTLCAACALSFALHGPAAASGTAASDNEYTRNQNVPPPKKGTSEERSSARKAQRADVKEQAKAGEVPTVGNDWGMNKNKAPAVAGTHETRSAERKVKRAELKEINKAGEMPVTNEAAVSTVKKNP